MIDAEAVIKVEQLQRVCAEHHMRYFIHNGSVCIQADSSHYTNFSEDNLLWMGHTVEQALAWMIGVFGGFVPRLVKREPFTPTIVGGTPKVVV